MTDSAAETDKQTSADEIRFGEAFRTWLRIALLSFGGPAGQIAMMHRILVEEKGWISERRFLHALNYCMLLPGPEAQQLTVYLGWLMHRAWGGIVAGILFVLPGAITVLALSMIYVTYQQLPLVEGLFFGVKAAVFAIVIGAVNKIAAKVLKNGLMWAIAIAAFLGIFVFDLPFPLIVLAAGLLGLVGDRLAPDLFKVIGGKKVDEEEAVLDRRLTRAAPVQTGWLRLVKVSSLCLALWITPILLAGIWLGPNHVYVQEGLFFSKMAVVTFGGAYAVLAYVAQQAVGQYGWLMPGEMLDGLGMAETTPGPLIMVVQFVGFLGAYRNPGMLDPMLAGVIGAMLTSWVTFVPCFLWIFLGAPYVEKMRENRYLSAALSAITAAVVGVIANLALWFGMNVVFADTSMISGPGFQMEIPVWSSIDMAALGLSVAAIAMMLVLRWGMLRSLGLCAMAGVALHLI